MIKSIVVHNISLDSIAAMERWYYRDHAPEIVRRYGPWLARHESYLPVPAPPEAQPYGVYNWRVTEGWWREIPEPGAKGCLSFTVPPVWPEVATCFIPAQPTEDFKGSEFQPHEKAGIRWFILFKYPAGVSNEEGDEWFQIHAKEVMKQPSLSRFFSYRTIKEPIGLPGTWAPGNAPPFAITHFLWDRVIELWYESFSDWRRSVVEAPPRYTKPSWATRDTYPFVRPFVEFVSSFILERPNDEFLRDVRAYMP
ncbi:MAG: hypothetical protein HY782_03170 [Chloroflexi bacterium]|nr:hypothetical protein [Chloroflexota bacterium]